jgi:farnesyl-diphosphate farnesyltransferase
MKWRLKRGPSPGNASVAHEFARRIMPSVSRTFAVGTSVLRGDLYWAVCVGYLMCRIADTIEDDGSATPERRRALLARYVETFDDPAAASAFGREAADIQGNPAHLELVANTGLVMEVLRALPHGSAAIVKRWTREMVSGMSEFVGRYPSGIRIQTMAEYRRYCYYVAGTVGHMLCDLWYFHSPAVHEREYQKLLADCEAFGEALQTINIIKDIPWDIEHENSAYVPEELLRRNGSSHGEMLSEGRLEANRIAVDELVSLARDDVRRSMNYINNIPKSAFRIRLFCLLPILFAVATLREIEQSTAMLRSGGAVKISRREVRALILAGSLSTVSNTTTRWLVDKTARRRFELGPAK